MNWAAPAPSSGARAGALARQRSEGLSRAATLTGGNTTGSGASIGSSAPPGVWMILVSVQALTGKGEAGGEEKATNKDDRGDDERFGHREHDHRHETRDDEDISVGRFGALHYLRPPARELFRLMKRFSLIPPACSAKRPRRPASRPGSSAATVTGAAPLGANRPVRRLTVAPAFFYARAIARRLGAS